MGAIKKKIKKYLLYKLDFPIYCYQNTSTSLKIRDYHSNNFNKYHNKFCKKDVHLSFNNNITRFRNYNNYKFADLALRNNPKGSFLSVGISYGTSLKVIVHLLEKKAKNNLYYLVDNFKNVGNDNFNTKKENVEKDLRKIKKFNFIFLEELLTYRVLKKIKNNLTFVHLNTGQFKTEYNFLKEIIKKCLNNSIIIIDNYGFYKKGEQLKIERMINLNKSIHSYISPSLQMILTIGKS